MRSWDKYCDIGLPFPPFFFSLLLVLFLTSLYWKVMIKTSKWKSQSKIWCCIDTMLIIMSWSCYNKLFQVIYSDTQIRIYRCLIFLDFENGIISAKLSELISLWYSLGYCTRLMCPKLSQCMSVIVFKQQCVQG